MNRLELVRLVLLLTLTALVLVQCSGVTNPDLVEVGHVLAFALTTTALE